VILVNDGSTDGTREVIAEYEPKLKQRGYEVIIVDQASVAWTRRLDCASLVQPTSPGPPPPWVLGSGIALL
jgi:glycosyltransferase involved in cell wall biosynthesis